MLHTKINFKWIRDLSIKNKIIDYLEVNKIKIWQNMTKKNNKKNDNPNVGKLYEQFKNWKYKWLLDTQI